MLIAGAVSAVATAVLFVLRRRRFGGPGEARRFQAALASGEVPDDADREHWRQVLADSRWWSRRVRVLTAVLGATTVVLTLISAASVPAGRVYALVLAAVFLVVTVTAERLARRNLRRAQRLSRTLAREAG